MKRRQRRTQGPSRPARLAQPGLARRKLEQARFFLELAQAASLPTQRAAQEIFVEAAIVFARSVEYYLRSEYGGKSGFKDWIETTLASLDHDGLLTFLADERAAVVHQGPANLGTDAAFISPGMTADNLTFDALPWKAGPALHWIRQYLDRLSDLIQGAESRFSDQGARRSE